MNTVALLLLLAGDIETNPGPYKPGMNQCDYLLSQAITLCCMSLCCLCMVLSVSSLSNFNYNYIIESEVAVIEIELIFPN